MASDDVQLIDGDLLEAVALKAAQSARLRMNHNFHASAQANPHRFLNVLLEGTYVRPHRHLDPPKDEAFLVLEGAAAVLLFNDTGEMTASYSLGKASDRGHLWGIDIAAGVWHTILALTPRVICFEVKPGPWDPATDKDFAAWAPPEGDPLCKSYLNQLTETAQTVSGTMNGAR
jgi:cupin fold WbuC family metalloprotein